MSDKEPKYSVLLVIDDPSLKTTSPNSYDTRAYNNALGQLSGLQWHGTEPIRLASNVLLLTIDTTLSSLAILVATLDKVDKLSYRYTILPQDLKWQTKKVKLSSTSK